jgi:hypothetical protein
MRISSVRRLDLIDDADNAPAHDPGTLSEQRDGAGIADGESR